MYHKITTNGTNVSKCCSIYFWTPCYQENPSNGMTARTPVCTSYGVVIGQTSRTLQADIEIWGLFEIAPILGLPLPAELRPTAALVLGGVHIWTATRSVARLSRACRAR